MDSTLEETSRSWKDQFEENYRILEEKLKDHIAEEIDYQDEDIKN